MTLICPPPPEPPPLRPVVPCVIGERYPEFCNKRFPTIAKLNEHMDRAHGPIYWCEFCSHKFNASLPAETLTLALREHHAKQCAGFSSEESKKSRSETFIMSREQYERFKSVRKVSLIEDKTTPDIKSWRRIREAIFPGSGAEVVKEELFQAPKARVIIIPGDSNGQAQSAAFQSDSGYESMKRDITKSLPSGVAEEGIVRFNLEEQKHVEQRIIGSCADDDTMTAYSGASSMAANDFDDWKAELSEKLFNDLCSIEPTLDSIRTLADALSPLLRSFALRLGSAGSSRAEREIMTFVHKRRDQIGAAFNKAVENSYHQESTPRLSDKNPAMSKNDILMWMDDINSDETSDVPQLDTTDLDDAEEKPSVLDERGYRELAFNSVAYRWLLASLAQKLTLQVVDARLDVHSLIQPKIFSCFEYSRSISRQEPSKQYDMTFIASWNPTGFLDEQFENQNDIGRLLGETLTLTGNATDAQILPCAEYLSQTWPTTGPTFLELLIKALVSGEEVSGELEDRTAITCEFTEPGLTVQVKGITDSIATIGEQIGWLGAALRPSCSESGFATCRPIFSISKVDIDTAKCSIEYPVIPMNITGDTTGQCWHAIFRNPVIVQGYPIPRRKRYGSGLEIPLNVMAGLNSSPRIHKYGGNYYLKGFSTALVPTEKIDNMVLWHLYYNDDGSRLPYPDPTGLHCADLGMQDLTAARHVIGWCSNAKFMTGAADMNYTIGASHLRRPGKEFVLEKLSFSFGQFVTGGCQFGIGRRDQHIRATKIAYIDKLKWLDKKYVTLWDVDDERGWLVNGNAALLHLLRSSLHHSSTDKFSSDFHFQAQDFQESKSPHTLDSALEVLRNTKNQRLELYDKDTDIQQGYVATSRTTVKDRVEELYEILEKLFDHTVTSEASSKGLNAKSRFQDHLEGWDFKDIATNRDPFFIKKATFGLSMLGWPDLTRAVSAITLFGKGFGDLIEATETQGVGECKEWLTVPKNGNLLCVSNSHLKDIIYDEGGNLDTNPVTVIPGLLWKAPSSNNPFDISCQCETRESSSRKHHAVQNLISKRLLTGKSQARVNLDDHCHGAVIFGPLIDWKRPWGSTSVVSRSGSQSSSISAQGGSATSPHTDSNDLASSSSSLPVSTSTEPQGQSISETPSIGPEASPPMPGSTTESLSPAEEAPGMRELKRFKNWFPS